MPRRLVLLLAAFTALAVTSLAGIATAAQTRVGSQNRVWALQTANGPRVGLNQLESSCKHQGSGVPKARQRGLQQVSVLPQKTNRVSSSVAWRTSRLRVPSVRASGPCCRSFRVISAARRPTGRGIDRSFSMR